VMPRVFVINSQLTAHGGIQYLEHYSQTCISSSVAVKDLRLEDKDMDLRVKDKDNRQGLVV